MISVDKTNVNNISANNAVKTKTSAEYKQEMNALLNQKNDLLKLIKSESDSAKKKALKIELNHLKREIKNLRFKSIFFVSDDIKYSGPLSYRWLRIIGWIALALAQILIINKVHTQIFSHPFLNGFGNVVLSLTSDITTPLFLIASVATILNRNKSFKSVLLFYLGGALLLGFAFILFFNRYIAGVIQVFDKTIDMRYFFADFLKTKVQFNIFVDLFLMTLFDFFISYTPKKYFKGKKIYIFRLLSIVPLLVVCASFAFKIIISKGGVYPPIHVYAFLTTKAPLVYIIFIALSLLMKNGERIFQKLGGTKEQWDAYSNTNRNSLRFSIAVSIILIVVSLIDILTVLIIALNCNPNDLEAGMEFALQIGFGQCAGLFAAVPFIMLFSYKKSYKNTAIDAVLPFIGVVLVSLVQLEGSFQILMKLQK